MATLAVVGSQPPRVVALAGPAFRIGRAPDCPLQLDDARCSKYHAEIVSAPERPGEFFLVDLQSTNGTFVNGERAAGRRQLRDGDRVQAGDTTIRFALGADPILPSTPAAETAADAETIVRTLPADHPPGLVPGGGGDQVRHVSALRFLLDLARAAEEAENPERLAAVLEDGLQRALDADRAFLFVGSDERMEPFERARPPPPPGAGRPFSRTVISRAARERVACLAHRAGDDAFREAESVLGQRIAGAIAVPLLAGGELLGALYADRFAPAKPFGDADLELAAAAGRQCALALLNVRRLDDLRAERDRLASELVGPAGFIGRSPKLAAVYDFIRRAAPTRAGVLILGESGTGKELVARAIHRQSPRGDRPFVIVNCAALSPTLVEADLFGHERGAYTGADRARPGRFQAAHGGTLFLDEIGELPESAQAKLLRALEDGEVTPVGESHPRRVDVRVVAATNQDLAARVKSGAFRSDLYYRLNILRVELPPLRDRADDIAPLAEHFAKFYGERCGRPRARLAPKTLERCAGHSWPGNVRELRNAIERAVILASGDEILPGDLPPEVGGAVPDPAAAAAAWTPDAAGTPPPTLADMEKRHVLAVLAWCGGNKKKAAEALAIDRSTLYARLRAYGIDA